MAKKLAGLALLFFIVACVWSLLGGEGSPEARTIANARNITFYEGLPHQNDEVQLLEAEKKAKPTVELHGFWFYKEPLHFKPGDLDVISSILRDTRSFSRILPGDPLKKCGGFHPDYALVWTSEGKTFRSVDLLRLFRHVDLRAERRNEI